MMTSQLAEIPLADQSHDGELRKTAALSGLKTPASRRSVLRGVAASALTVGALSLTWGNSGRAFADETSPDGRVGWDETDCKGAYPEGYDEEPDASGQFKTAQAACFGGVISSDYCDATTGWHRADTSSDGQTKYTPDPSRCSEKASWQWKTPDGKVYRCSDGTTTVTANGQTQNIDTICRALVS